MAGWNVVQKCSVTSGGGLRSCHGRPHGRAHLRPEVVETVTCGPLGRLHLRKDIGGLSFTLGLPGKKDVIGYGISVKELLFHVIPVNVIWHSLFWRP